MGRSSRGRCGMESLYVMIKPVSGLCNMRCKYCFYMDEMYNRNVADYGRMSEETLELIIRQSMEEAGREVTFSFQGGEPTLRGLAFYEKALDLQDRYNRRRVKVHNLLQTNGYDLDEEWCRFFKENRFLIGLSLDGIWRTHDANRVSPDGGGTFSRCLDSAKRLKKFGVEFNVLTVVNRQTAPRIRKIYQQYEKWGFAYQQYIACLDPVGEEKGGRSYSLSPLSYGQFLCELFDVWYEDWKRGKQPYIRNFENYIGALLGYLPESCEQGRGCTVQFVIEADGSVFPCDFYMLDEFCLGNIREGTFEDMRRMGAEMGFASDAESFSEDCSVCRYEFLCHGGCRRHWYGKDKAEGRGNCFCESYKMFFGQCFEGLERVAAGICERGC